ncbi:hypothetical protein GRX03_10610 [Halovenus sp. WSH3]|uniref:Uncharacterized protein n=1 Tax=Halovenus carboxidivorans TaxID=2692199 RepID=A0A6B0T1G2_9EURY|nr:hypothetical protein [Halovenus carboxidivorans]MXR52048.1 hypothetical protein [Halovenus carboxidivorans]
MNSENYGQAESEASTAQQHFSSAASGFAQALDLAYEINNERVQQICSDAEEHASMMEQAMWQAEQAAKYSREGNIESANEAIDQSNSLESEANTINVRDARDVARILGVE